MFVTTLSSKLLDEYGRQTVASWSRATRQAIVVVVSPDEAAAFRGVLDSAYTVAPFSAASLAGMAAIRIREEALNFRRGDYRFQASRFAWKVFAIAEAFDLFPQEESITWLDADSLLKSDADTWMQGLFSQSHAVSFLGRAHKQLHVESGLMNFRGDEGRRHYRQVVDAYRSLTLFDFNEWHDGYVVTPFFQFSKHCYDISKHHGVRSSNPLYEIDRGRHVHHLKGQRKGSSSSLMDDLRVLLRR